MPFYYRLGWPLAFLGPVIILVAMLVYAFQDSVLEREWLQFSMSYWRSAAADRVARKRAQLSIWPGVVAGIVVTGAGLLLLDLRRRRRDLGTERVEMEQRFEEGRPVVFKSRDDSEDARR